MPVPSAPFGAGTEYIAKLVTAGNPAKKANDIVVEGATARGMLSIARKAVLLQTSVPSATDEHQARAGARLASCLRDCSQVAFCGAAPG